MDRVSFADISLEALFNRSAGPFFLSVTYEVDGTYRALSGPLVQKQGVIIEGIDGYLKTQWLGSNKQAEDALLKKHLASGGILSFVASGAVVGQACEQALTLADETGKKVYFIHNDSVHIAFPNVKKTEARKLSGFYAQ